MAEIQIDPTYNYWQILKLAGVDPSLEPDRYSYNNGTLTVPDIDQQTLDNALANYDHNTWLEELNEIKKGQMTLELSVDKTQIAAGDAIIVTVISNPAVDVTVDLLIDGSPANELQLTNGQGQDTFNLVDAGKYLIEAIYGDIRKYLFVEAV